MASMNHGPLIDTHQHPIPEFYKRAMARVGITGSGENPWADWSLQAQLDLMDETGIAAAVNSIASPGAYFGDVGFAVQVSRECNEGLAQIVRDHPRRFGGFALLPLPAIAEAVAEATYALDTLKLDGICLLTHAGQRHLGHPDENELYAELDRRKAVVFIHPLRNQAQHVPAYGYPAGMTELVVDTTRAVANLLWNGTFGKFPNIRWIMPHGAGTVPFLAYRLSAMDKKPAIRAHLPGGSVASALRGLYYDVAEVVTPPALQCLMATTDTSHILFGSDFPFSRHKNPAQDVRDTISGFEAFDGWNASARRDIEYNNAAKLFPRLAANIDQAKTA
jgi:predicted TIM-barrel fold metal-dependent hydrolase